MSFHRSYISRNHPHSSHEPIHSAHFPEWWLLEEDISIRRIRVGLSTLGSLLIGPILPVHSRRLIRRRNSFVFSAIVELNIFYRKIKNNYTVPLLLSSPWHIRNQIQLCYKETELKRQTRKRIIFFFSVEIVIYLLYNF